MYSLKGLMMIFYPIVTIFVKLKFAFKTICRFKVYFTFLLLIEMGVSINTLSS